MQAIANGDFYASNGVTLQDYQVNAQRNHDYVFTRTPTIQRTVDSSAGTANYCNAAQPVQRCIHSPVTSNMFAQRFVNKRGSGSLDAAGLHREVESNRCHPQRGFVGKWAEHAPDDRTRQRRARIGHRISKHCDSSTAPGRWHLPRGPVGHNRNG